MRTGRLSFLLIFLALGVAGCSPDEIDPDVVAGANTAYGLAQEAIARGDYQAAEQQLTTAIDLHGLNVDLYLDARVKRALCRAALGNYAGAHEDLDAIEQGVQDVGRYYAAQAYVYTREGRETEADAALDKAYEVDPNIEPIQF